MIHSLPHDISPGLQQENEVHAQVAAGCAAQDSKHACLADFLQEYMGTTGGSRFVRSLPPLAKGAMVLDVGVGAGHSSIFLASRGCQVHAVEPSLALCRVLEETARRFALPLEIYHTTAEALGPLPADRYDAVVFNASFHHCDGPAAALAHCRRLLRPDGMLLLLNEPQLQIYTSKARYYRRLQEAPEEMGHYGGNEHTYYYHEYLAMLRQAGFQEVQTTLAPRYLHPDDHLAQLRHQHQRGAKLLARQWYYRTVVALTKGGAAGDTLLALLRRLSLVQTNFQARKAVAG